MKKSYFIELAQYNIWANDIVVEWLQQISEQQWNADITSSFNSIALTCIHIAGAEKVWYERWINKSSPVFLFNEFNGSKNELIAIWKQASQNIHEFIQTIEDEKLNNLFTFKRLNGEYNEMLYWQSFAHVINHSTYHRGQLVTMFRQVGFANVSSTDYLTYTRK